MFTGAGEEIGNISVPGGDNGHTIGSYINEGSGLFSFGSTIPILTPIRGGVPRRSGVTSEAQDTSPSSLISMRISSSCCINASKGVAMGSGVTSGSGRATSNVVTTGAMPGIASVPSNGTNGKSSAGCYCCCCCCWSATSNVALGASNAGDDECPKEEIGVVCQYSIARGSTTDDLERQ